MYNIGDIIIDDDDIMLVVSEEEFKNIHGDTDIHDDDFAVKILANISSSGCAINRIYSFSGVDSRLMSENKLLAVLYGVEL